MKTLVLCAAFCVVASAQTKISGTGKCGKPDSQQVQEVGDRANHAMVLVKQTCTWTAPMEMEGLKSTGYTVVVSSDSSGAKSQDRGYVVVTMDNGDKAFVRFTGTAMYGKDGAPESGDGTWSYTGGTGKLKGLTGKGTFKGKASADGYMDQVEGEYTIAPAKPKK